MSTFTGKISRLSQSIREELNRRLAAREPGPAILTWLNHHPEVQSHLRASETPAPISPQNLSNYRRGEFAEWQARQEFFNGLKEMTADATEIAAILGDDFTEHVARLITLHLANLLCPAKVVRGEPPRTTPDAATLKILCQMSRAVALLRRTHRPSATQHQPAPAPQSNTVAQNSPVAPHRPYTAYTPHRAYPSTSSPVNPASLTPPIKPHQANSSPPLHIPSLYSTPASVPPSIAPGPSSYVLSQNCRMDNPARLHILP